MTEDKLTSLFQQIKEEPVQTNLSEINAWIEKAAVTVGFLAALKLILIKKPLIMFSSLISLTGITVAGVVLFTTPDATTATSSAKETEKHHSYNSSFPSEERVTDQSQSEERPSEFTRKVENPVNSVVPVEKTPVTKLRQIQPFLRQLTGLLPVMTTTSSGDFTTIKASGAIYIKLTQGSNCSVEVVPDTEKDAVNVEISNGVLKLSNNTNNNHSNKNKDITVLVSIVNLESVEMSGATSMQSTNQLKTTSLNVELTGASNLDLDVQAASIRAEMTGASDLEIKGTAEKLDVEATGASNADFSKASIQTAQMEGTGASVLKVDAVKSLTIDLSGASNAYYYTKPEILNIETSGASKVIQKNR